MHYSLLQLTLSLLAVMQYHLVTVSPMAWSGVHCLITVELCAVVSQSNMVSPTDALNQLTYISILIMKILTLILCLR